MTVWNVSLLLTLLLAGAPAPCFAQETDSDFSDSALTREQWQQRLESARRRSEEFVANARAQKPTPPPGQVEVEATRRAMNDPTLRQGDIVATGKGFVVFTGRDEEHQPDDFKAAPNHPP